MPLEGSLQISGFVVVEKEIERDAGRGVFREGSLSFMALHTEAEELRPSAWVPADLAHMPVAETIQVSSKEPLLAALGNCSFKWYVQWARPTVYS